MIRVHILPEQLVQGIASEIQIIITNTFLGRCTRVMLDLHIPASLLLINGVRHVEFDILEKGETKNVTLIIKPKKTGYIKIPLGNFSYRGPDGQVRIIKEQALYLDITSTDRRIPPGIPFEVELSDSVLIFKEWGLFQGKVRNQGEWTTGILTLAVEGPVEYANCVLGPLSPDTESNFTIKVKPVQIGEHVPINIKVINQNGTVLFARKASLKVIEPSTTQSAGTIISGGKVDINYGVITNVNSGGDSLVQVRSQTGLPGQSKASVPVCPGCGKQIITPTKFCQDCGAKLTDYP